VPQPMIVTVTKPGRIVLTKPFMELLGVGVGDKLMIFENEKAEGVACIMKATTPELEG